MSLKQKLFWEKYRPKTLKQLILLPRIESLIKNGVTTNLILFGNSGTGKSSLSRILCKDLNSLEINTSLDTSIDILREDITQHCDTLSFQFDKNTMKVVFLDEFDKASDSYQKALKPFIEKYSDSVRFILTTNYINQIDPELQSRFTKINFDPINKQEIDFLQNGYFIYLKAVSKAEKMNISDDDIKKIISKSFPDLRVGVQHLQEISIVGSSNILTQYSGKYYIDFYKFMLDSKNNSTDNFLYIIENFTENPESGFTALGRSFFEYLMEENNQILQKNGQKILVLSKQYNAELQNTIDPLLHLIAYVTEMKQLLL